MVYEDGLRVNPHARPRGSCLQRAHDDADVRFGNAVLPAPRVPCDVRIEANRFVWSTTSRHGSHKGWVNPGAMPRG